ncbi:hypothetical protein HX030_15095 [Myroides odoratimimus]|nr:MULTISPECIES: hypothetical protein [Myroides]MDM1411794.1 hypothetical protein [Myroides odoratimimus]MDM1451399.1 hypothetical protein [Myroides odoratimimus]MDM1468349.1 hypothetical protein [Myroides odoratimimus]MDM1471844.1 hypothetical protein [Myroides odoratimimus]MDM1481870.1 hypothetical protein [Myroides odoratimimus]
MRFINAIELVPFNYAKSDYQSPIGNAVNTQKNGLFIKIRICQIVI